MAHPAPQSKRSIHPGSGRRGRDMPKGRQVDPEALAEVQALLGDRSRQRDLLIEHLHLLQDKYHCLHARHLAALAMEMKLALVEVYEVASFYAHFDIVMDDEPAPPPLTVRVCDSLSCELAGAQQLLKELPSKLGSNVRVVRAPCMGGCHNAPAVAIGHALHEHATVESVTNAASKGEAHPHISAYPGLDAYRTAGGYKLLEACLAGSKSVEDVMKALEDSALRGLGTLGTKSEYCSLPSTTRPARSASLSSSHHRQPPRALDCASSSSRRGRRNGSPRICEWLCAIEAPAVYLYLRDEYPQCREILQREIAALQKAGLSRHTDIHLRRGAGAYICGEESAMLESIEGKRGLPRHKPPYPSQVGLFGRPTLINNVETLFWVRDVVEKGAQWFASQGRRDRKGPRSFSVSQAQSHATRDATGKPLSA